MRKDSGRVEVDQRLGVLVQVGREPVFPWRPVRVQESRRLDSVQRVGMHGYGPLPHLWQAHGARTAERRLAPLGETWPLRGGCRIKPGSSRRVCSALTQVVALSDKTPMRQPSTTSDKATQPSSISSTYTGSFSPASSNEPAPSPTSPPSSPSPSTTPTSVTLATGSCSREDLSFGDGSGYPT